MKSLTVLSTISILLATCAASAQNELYNPGFETWGTNNGFAELTGQGGVQSGAAYWLIANFGSGTTTTQEVASPPGLLNAGNYSLYITSTAAGNGIEESFEQSQMGNDVNGLSGWVGVVQGSVQIQLGTGTDVFTTYLTSGTTSGWVSLVTNPQVSGIFGITVLATSPNTEFYVDNMDADASLLTPEPSPLAALGLGVLCLGRRWSRGRK